MKRHDIRALGGAGSGHHGHKGIPGQRGGSLPKGGAGAVGGWKPIAKGYKKGASTSAKYEARALAKNLGDDTPMIGQSSVISGTTASFGIKKSLEAVQDLLKVEGYTDHDGTFISRGLQYKVTIRPYGRGDFQRVTVERGETPPVEVN